MPQASQFFESVAALLAGIAVTDGHGNTMQLDDGAAAAVDEITGTSQRGGKILLIGNGGSASIAGHMEMDLCNRADTLAMVFNDPPVLTGLSNDYGYVHAFERLVTLAARQGDLLIAISSSGQSENILRAVAAARGIGCRIMTFSGFQPDNPLRSSGDINFYVASSHYGEVEVAHHALGHYLTDSIVEFTGRKAKESVS